MKREEFIKILNKKQITAKDVGRARLSIFIKAVKEKTNQENEDVIGAVENLMLSDEIEQRGNKHFNNINFKEFEPYNSLFNVISSVYNSRDEYEIKIKYGVTNLKYYLSEFKRKHEAKHLLDNEPLLLTPSQYEKLNEAVNNEHYKSTFSDYQSLFFNIFECVINERYKNNELSEKINKYFYVPLEKEEQEKFKSEKLIEYSLNPLSYLLFYNGSKAIKKYIKENSTHNIDCYSDKEIMTEFKEFIKNYDVFEEENENTNLLQVFMNVLTTKEVKEFNKYDNAGNVLLYYYENNDLEAIKTHFKDVYECIDKIIIDNIPNIKNGIVDLKEVKNKDIETLSKVNDFDVCFTASNIFNNQRAFNGIATLKYFDNFNVDEQGNFIEQSAALNLFKDVLTLNDEDVSTIKEAVEYIQEGFMWFASYNQILEIIEKVYKISDLYETARYDLENFINKLNNYNQDFCEFYFLQEEPTQQAMKKLNAVIEIENLKPSKVQITKITKEIKTNYKNNMFCDKQDGLSYFIEKLCGNV